MNQLVFSSSFKRAYKSTLKRKPNLKQKIDERLRLLAANPYNPILRTHKLKGKLANVWACSVDYDCRIVFDFVRDPEGHEEILLIDLGTHDEVY